MANQKKTFMSVLLNGLIWENPTFVLMLGMCPTLAITTSGMNGIGMGLAVTAVLIFSNLFTSCCATSSGQRAHSGVHHHHRVLRDDD